MNLKFMMTTENLIQTYQNILLKMTLKNCKSKSIKNICHLSLTMKQMTPQRRLSMLINLRKSKILNRYDKLEISKNERFQTHINNNNN